MNEGGLETSTTTIWNRESIVELLARELARTAYDARDLLVLLVGLDPIAAPPEQNIEPQRDLIVQEVANRLRVFLRTYDHIGRYDKNTLLILPLSASVVGGLELVEQLRESIAQEPVQVLGTTIPVTISIAATTSADFPSRVYHDILSELEGALGKAQSDGGNRVETIGRALAPVQVFSSEPFRVPIRPILGLVLLTSIAVLVFVQPFWTCAPFRLHEVFADGELPAPLPANCVATQEAPSQAIIESLDKQREAAGLMWQETVTCKMPLTARSREARLRDQQWLSRLYVNGSYQYRRHVFFAASEQVPDGTLLTVESCLMRWWDYIKQPGDACWADYAFWR